MVFVLYSCRVPPLDRLFSLFPVLYLYYITVSLQIQQQNGYNAITKRLHFRGNYYKLLQKREPLSSKDSLRLLLLVFSAHMFGKLYAAYYMEMQVLYRLAAVFADIGNDTVAA